MLLPFVNFVKQKSYLYKDLNRKLGFNQDILAICKVDDDNEFFKNLHREENAGTKLSFFTKLTLAVNTLAFIVER